MCDLKHIDSVFIFYSVVIEHTTLEILWLLLDSFFSLFFSPLNTNALNYITTINTSGITSPKNAARSSLILKIFGADVLLQESHSHGFEDWNGATVVSTGTSNSHSLLSSLIIPL